MEIGEQRGGDGGLLPNEIGCTVLKRDGLVALA